MNSKRQLSAIKNRDWSSKTQKENAKYVRSKLDMLGYRVPAYMKKGLINQQQLEFYTNRIMNKLEKINEKEQRKKRKPRESNEQKLNRLINELNSRLDEVHKYIDKNYTGQMSVYLKGEMNTLTTRDKSFAREKFDARKIDLDSFNYKDVKSAIKMVQGRLNITTLGNFIKSLNDSSDNDNWFSDKLLNDSLLEGLGEIDKNALLREFNEMTPIQKEFYLKDYLSELREKYKTMEEQANSGDDYFDYDKIGYVLFNKTMTTMNIYKSL